jgi:hypothetical protein
LHDYDNGNGKASPKPPRSLKSPRTNVKSRLYEGNTTYKNRLEESKKMIQDNKRKEIKSPKRFQTGNKSPNGTPNENNRSLKSRPPLGSNKTAVTSEKVRNIEKYKKVDGSQVRNSFKSPNAVRKTPLIQSQKPDTIRNNVSAARAGTRRTRLERTANIESDMIIIKGPSDFYEQKYHQPGSEFTNTFSSSELQMQECPVPTPVPKRFTQENNSKRSSNLSENYSQLEMRHDLDLDDEANFEFQEEANSIIGKIPFERRSITNSKVFSMSDTQFTKFDADNEIEDYLEVNTDEDFVLNVSDINRESM